jgi:hypothetical protein
MIPIVDTLILIEVIHILLIFLIFEENNPKSFNSSVHLNENLPKEIFNTFFNLLHDVTLKITILCAHYYMKLGFYGLVENSLLIKL